MMPLARRTVQSRSSLQKLQNDVMEEVNKMTQLRLAPTVMGNLAFTLLLPAPVSLTSWSQKDRPTHEISRDGLEYNGGVDASYDF